MGSVVVWAGRISLAYIASEIFGSVADTAQAGEKSLGNVAKIAPWVVAGLAVYVITQRRR